MKTPKQKEEFIQGLKKVNFNSWLENQLEIDDPKTDKETEFENGDILVEWFFGTKLISVCFYPTWTKENGCIPEYYLPV